MPLGTEKLRRNSSEEVIQEAISSAIETLMREWEGSGKMGSSRPADKEEARKQAVAIAYADARRHAGVKRVPKAGG